MSALAEALVAAQAEPRDTMSAPTLRDVERFLAKIEVAPNGCHEWQGTRMRLGYGQFGGKHRGENRMLYAHRVAYAWWRGPITDGLTVDHLCANTCCVNPLHLELVTAAENIRRAGERITHCKHGHEFTESNTYRNKQTGRRECRACNARRGRETRARRRENVEAQEHAMDAQFHHAETIWKTDLYDSAFACAVDESGGLRGDVRGG